MPGGGEGIRTPDPRVANAVLCQLSYTPEPIAELRMRMSECSTPHSAISNPHSQRVGCGGGI